MGKVILVGEPATPQARDMLAAHGLVPLPSEKPTFSKWWDQIVSAVMGPLLAENPKEKPAPRPGSIADRVSKWFAKHEGCAEAYSVGSRQQRRAATRKQQHAEVKSNFGQEPRQARRRIAIRRARSHGRTGLVLGPRGRRGNERN